MKKYLAIIFTFVLSVNVMTQTVDEILENHFNTIGQEQLVAEGTMIVDGLMKMPSMGMEMPVNVYIKRPDKFKSVTTIQGMEIVNILNGGKGWMLNPMQGQSEYTEMNDEEIERLKVEADIDGPLYNYEEKGHSVEKEENQEFNGIDCYVLKVTQSTGDVIRFFIDAENYIILQTVSTVSAHGQEAEIHSVFSNYQEIKGVLLPMQLDISAGGQSFSYIYNSVKLGETIDDSEFVVPVKEEE